MQKIGDRERVGVVGKIDVSVLNGNGKSLVEVSSESGMTAGNIWFRKKMIYKYEDKNTLDFILVDSTWKNWSRDGPARGVTIVEMSDHRFLR